MSPLDNPAWRDARLKLLEAEKAHMREADRLAEARRALPPVEVKRAYRFDGPNGSETLADLFGGHSQLAIYHFMFGEDWAEGCPSCSFWADNLDRLRPHLAARDVALVMVASAPYDVLSGYGDRLGWSHAWRSAEPDFSRDMGVRFDADTLEAGDQVYNFRKGAWAGQEMPGLSGWSKSPSGQIQLHYATYARGLESFNGAYSLLDMMPAGRDEGALDYPMAWLRRRDSYGANP